jgi:hypothetical protein
VQAGEIRGCKAATEKTTVGRMGNCGAIRMERRQVKRLSEKGEQRARLKSPGKQGKRKDAGTCTEGQVCFGNRARAADLPAK